MQGNNNDIISNVKLDSVVNEGKKQHQQCLQMHQDLNEIASTAFATVNFTTTRGKKVPTTSGISDANTSLLPVDSFHFQWIHNSLLPQQVPLFQHLSSFTREVDISRNSMVESCLLNNKTILLPLICIIIKIM